jgi:hypothetical protein
VGGAVTIGGADGTGVKPRPGDAETGGAEGYEASEGGGGAGGSGDTEFVGGCIGGLGVEVDSARD